MNRRKGDLERLSPWIKFDYNLPPEVHARFPHDRVFGRVSKLMRVRNVQKYEVALQTILGGRLRSVIVDSN